MQRFTKFALAGIIALLSLIALTGCERAPETPPPPPTRYSVKLYGDSVEPLRTFVGTGGTAGEGIAYIVRDGDTEYTKIAGTFVIEPVDTPSSAERSADSKYRVTLYGSNGVLRIWYVPYATAGEGIAYLKTSEKFRLHAHRRQLHSRASEVNVLFKLKP